MIDFDGIRKEVAIRHGLLLDSNDPVLVTVTLNELVFQRYADILVERNMELLKAIEAAQQKGIAEAKQTAGRVITEATNYVSEQVNTAVTAGLDEGMFQVKKDLTKAWLEIQAVKKVVVTAAALSCFCTIVTLVVAITVI